MDLPNGKSFSQPNARARSRHIQPRIINPFSVHVTISYPFPIPRTYARCPHRVTIWWSRAHPYSPLLPTTGTPGIQAWWWPGGPRGRLRALCTLLRARPIFYAFLIQTAMFSILSFYELLLLYIHTHSLIETREWDEERRVFVHRVLHYLVYDIMRSQGRLRRLQLSSSMHRWSVSVYALYIRLYNSSV